MVEHTGQKIVIENVVGQLPLASGRAWPARTSPVRSVTVHHTGGSTRLAGFSAAKATHEFSQRRDDPETPELEGHAWPGIPYHYFIPSQPAQQGGRLVIFRCVPDELVTNHAGAWNSESIAVVFQGGLTAWVPSPQQYLAWSELAPYLLNRHGIDPFEIWPHAWRGKPACPGSVIVSWLLEARDSVPHITSEDELRRALERVGFCCGHDHGGFALRGAVSAFQRSARIQDRFGKWHPALAVDGVAGPATESMLRRALRAKGVEL